MDSYDEITNYQYHKDDIKKNDGITIGVSAIVICVAGGLLVPILGPIIAGFGAVGVGYVSLCSYLQYRYRK